MDSHGAGFFFGVMWYNETMKSFFKPTWGKAILFVVLSVILWFSSWLIAFKYAGGEYTPPVFWIVDLGLALAAKLRLPGGDFINTVYSLIYWYFLSCLIVWVYRKIKNRNQSPTLR